MSSSFFQDYGNEVHFEDYADLVAKFSNIDCSVPAPNEGRTSEHRERYCLNFYLLALGKPKLSLLTFPLTVQKSEAPDFLIRNGTGQTTGLEHTDATTENYKQALNMWAKSKEATQLKPDLFWGKRRSKNQIKATLRPLGTPLIGDTAEEGNEVVRKWSYLIAKAVRDKTDGLNKGHYARADAYDLLIYSSTPSSPSWNIHLHVALSMVKLRISSLYQKTGYAKKFRRISVIENHSGQDILLYDVTGNEFNVF